MPFASERQRRYLWANRPDIARRWADEEEQMRDHKPMMKDPPRQTPLRSEAIGRLSRRIRSGMVGSRRYEDSSSVTTSRRAGRPYAVHRPAGDSPDDYRKGRLSKRVRSGGMQAR